MDGFQRRREKKKKSILQAAFELFSTRGVKEASIAEIAEKAHVSQVSIYNFFESKENLVRQAIFEFMDEKMKASEAVLESELPFRDKLEKLFFITEEARQESGPDLLLSVIGSDPLIRKLMAEYRHDRTEPFILRLVEQGKKEGCINPNLSNEAVQLFINALSSVLAQPSLPTNIRRDLDSLFFYGLQGKPEN